MYEFLDYQVRDVMSQPVVLAEGATLAQAEELLEGRGFNGAPVVDGDGRLRGWMTSLDLLRAFDFPQDEILPSYEKVMQTPVERVMQRDVFGVTPRAPLARVIEKMVDRRARSFPVLEDSIVVGIVARRDLMRALRRACSGVAP